MESEGPMPGRGGLEGRGYLVTGRVQGVGFRWWTARLAEGIGVIGWVRNRPDGAVEIEAWGDAEQLDHFERRLLEGPPGARVSDVVRTSAGAVVPVSRRFSIRG